MPSLILTGHPSAGKSTFAELLAARALAHKSSLIKSTIIINEESARPDKTLRKCYADSTEEKLTRGALKSEFDKFVKDPTKLVILDSMNYIKGFRYELHCISKSAGQKHGVVWTLNREDVAKKWNEKRSKDSTKEDYFYTQEMMDELMARYEPPDQRNRWDRPLYRVDVHATLEDSDFDSIGLSSAFSANGSSVDGDETGLAAEQALNRSVYNMHSLSDAIRDTSQSKVITNSMGSRSGFKRRVGAGFKRAVKKEDGDDGEDRPKLNHQVDPPTMSESEKGNDEMTNTNNISLDTHTHEKSQQNVKRQVKKMDDLIDTILDSFLLDVEPLKAGLSTIIQRSAKSNVLHDVDSVSLKAMTEFLAAQKSISTGGGKIVVRIGSSGQTTRTIELKRLVQIAELKRLRRQYVKCVTANPPNDTSEEGIANSFLSYVQNQV
jgi:protein KTI12